MMPNGSLRFQVALEYRGRSWSTVQVDLSRGEGDTTEIELVEPLALEPFGLDTPPALPCLSLRYHIAQKIHGMTQPPKGDEEANERFRDLADLLLMRELATDLPGVREACVEVFELRGTHAWPPAVEPPEVWQEPFAALAAELGLRERTLSEGVCGFRSMSSTDSGACRPPIPTHAVH